jgi:chemotaxis-related protein WspD
MTELPLRPQVTDCWNRIGVRGDRSCPELTTWGHCYNCPVFAAAGRHFLDAPCPTGYLEEWTDRLSAPVEGTAADLESVLIFRLGEEWLALPVNTLVEVTAVRPVRRVPFRRGLLAGLVSIRGELHLCVRLGDLLGLSAAPAQADAAPAGPGPAARLLVVRRDADRWVFLVDEVDQVQRFPARELMRMPATLARAASRLSRGVVHWQGRAIGILNEERLFGTLRAKIQ